MTENPFAPPKSRLEDADVRLEKHFYVVSKRKFIVLFIATLGLYQLYWFYRNWKLQREATGENLWPIPRAIFSIFFTHSLFRRVSATLEAQAQALPWNHSGHASMLVGLMVVSQFLDRLSAKSIASPFTDLLSLLMIVPLLFCFLKAQVVINMACGDPEGLSNSEFTAANYVWIVLGILFWLLVIVGVYSVLAGIES